MQEFDAFLNVLNKIRESGFPFYIIIWLLYKVFVQFKTHFDDTASEHKVMLELLRRLCGSRSADRKSDDSQLGLGL